MASESPQNRKMLAPVTRALERSHEGQSCCSLPDAAPDLAARNLTVPRPRVPDVHRTQSLDEGRTPASFWAGPLQCLKASPPSWLVALAVFRATAVRSLRPWSPSCVFPATRLPLRPPSPLRPFRPGMLSPSHGPPLFTATLTGPGDQGGDDFGGTLFLLPHQ